MAKGNSKNKNKKKPNSKNKIYANSTPAPKNFEWKDVVPEIVQDDPVVGTTKVHIVTNGGNNQRSFEMRKDSSMQEVKEEIGRLLGLRAERLQLKYGRQELANTHRLEDCRNQLWDIFQYFLGIFNLSNSKEDAVTLSLQVSLNENWCDPCSQEDYYFDPEKNKDFRQIQYQGSMSLKGGFKYITPIKSYLKVLKVRDKYEDNIWLGDEGKEGEWAVAYHGSSFENIQKIIKSGSLQEKFAKICTYGSGIYCSPLPSEALVYSHAYSYKKKRYRALLQVRVHPEKVKIVPEIDYWVVPEKYIRITGVCIYSGSDYLFA